MAWDYHVGEYAKDRYDIILGRYILTSLGLNFKFSKCAIQGGGGPLKGYTATIHDLGTYKFKYLNKGRTAPDVSFMNVCI